MVIAMLLFARPFSGGAPVRELSPIPPLPSLRLDAFPAAPPQITVDAAPADSNAEVIAPVEVRSFDRGIAETSKPPTVQGLDVAPDRAGPATGPRIAQRAGERGDPVSAGPVSPHSK
jgi:hypothetical protein